MGGESNSNEGTMAREGEGLEDTSIREPFSDITIGGDQHDASPSTPREQNAHSSSSGSSPLATHSLGESFWNNMRHETSTDWEEGIEIIESILTHKESQSGLSDKQIEGLHRVHELLLSGSKTLGESHIPRGLLGASSSEMESTSEYILAAFAGVARKSVKTKVFKVVNAQRFVTRLQGSADSSRKLHDISRDAYLPPEWKQLDVSERKELTEILSWENLQKWNFDIFAVDRLTHGQPLLFVGWAILASPYSQYAMRRSLSLGDAEDDATIEGVLGYGYIDQFKLPPKNLCNFLREVESQYLSTNQYHNNIHAADVVQTLHCILDSMDVKALAGGDLEIFALLLAAAVHDIGHPGKNNLFQVNTHSDLALTYNDSSVLENFHAASAFRILYGSDKNPNVDILVGMSDDQARSVRKMVVECILDTDMTKHFAKVDKIKSNIQLSTHTNSHHHASSTTTRASFSGKKTRRRSQGSICGPQGRLFKDTEAWAILSFVLHLADISNPAKPRDLAIKWTDRCLEEFFQQGDEEKRLNLPQISPLCDRETTNRADSQIGFIKFVVLPAFEVLGQIFPAVQEVVLPILHSNLEYWKGQKEIETAVADDIKQS